MINFCKQFFNDLIEYDRTLIKPYELDIVIPELYLAIEFNGVYYHSVEAGTPLGYHLMKTKMCETLNYKLIHIWEDEWNNNNEKVKNNLLKIFNNENLILFEDEKQIVFDRCNTSLNDLRVNFNKIEETKPQLILRDRYHVEDCGTLIVTK